MLNRRSYVPLYVQIVDRITEKVNSGEWSPGAKLPSERELAQTYDVSRLTARQALQTLVSQGIVYVQQGRGTFVAQSTVRAQLSSFDSFSREMRRRGLEPSSRVLIQRLVQPSSHIRAKLQLSEGDPALQLDRLRLADGVPIALESSFINIRLFPGLENHDLENNSLYDLMGKVYGVYPEWADAEIEAHNVTAPEAEMLQISPHQAVLVTYHLIYNRAFEPLEYVKAFYRSDRFTLYVGRHRLISAEERDKS